MTRLTFDIAVNRLLEAEGGYVNDENDPGGETNWGISKRSYPQLDIRHLTREDAKAIYKRDFWLPLRGLPESVLFQLFDFAVNSGIGNAVRSLQSAINVSPDGHWGPHSQSVAATYSESDLLMCLIAARMDFMTVRKNWPAHGKGWTRRMADNLRFAAQDNEV